MGGIPSVMSIAIPVFPPAVLCLSAGDATGGGGLLADALTLASMGCHPLAVQTAALVCDTRGVEEVIPSDAGVIAAQARAVLEDIPVSVFRLGLGGSVEAIAAIAEILSDYPEIPLVLEPALCVGGAEALDEDMPAVLAGLILPQTTLLVAGRHEILRLAGADIDEDGESAALSVEEAVSGLFSLGIEYILLTDGGGQGAQVINLLFDESGVIRTDAWERLPGRFIGADTTLATAAAAALAHGMNVPEAVREAQEFTWQTLRHAYRPGMGLALPDRFFWARVQETDDE